MRIGLLKALIVFLVGGAAWGASYTVTDMGMMPGGTSINPVALSNTGQIVGTYRRANGTIGSFSWSAGVYQDVAGFDSLGGEGKNTTYAYDISDAGLVVGWSQPLGGQVHGFIYDTSIPFYSLVPASSYPVIYPLAISPSGKYVVGEDQGLPFLYKVGSPAITRLTPPGAVSGQGFSVNDSGQVLAYGNVKVNPATTITNYFLYDAGVWTNLTTTTGITGSFMDLNAQGDILADPNGNPFILKEDGTRTYLKTAPGGAQLTMARGMNDSGQAIGFRYGSQTHALAYTPGSGWVDLNTVLSPVSSLTVLDAYDINNRGQILAVGWSESQRKYSYLLLTPVATPEPAGYGAIAAAGLAVAAWARRRKSA